MSEYGKDSEGDVWSVDGDFLRHYRWSDGGLGDRYWKRARETVADTYGALSACDESGKPLAETDVRALVTAAFLDFAERLHDGFMGATEGSPAEAAYQAVSRRARETAAAILSGEVKGS